MTLGHNFPCAQAKVTLTGITFCTAIREPEFNVIPSKFSATPEVARITSGKSESGQEWRRAIQFDGPFPGPIAVRLRFVRP
jgi:hypothetical protein